MSQRPHSDPQILKNLDDFRVWPIKHRHWKFELIEDESHNTWISTSDLRLFYVKFPTDRELKTRHRTSLLYAKDVKAHYLSERAARIELAKSKSHSSHTDVLKFLDWFERNVSQVAAKKRENRHLDARNGQRQQHEESISFGVASYQLASPQLDATTIPLTPEERWVLEQDLSLIHI